MNKIEKKVIIFLASFNGEKFIKDQLYSIKKQTFKNWQLIISDDGSNDRTLEIIKNFQKSMPSQKVILVEGPKLGYANNFLSMVTNKYFVADYYAFSDQDDWWLEEKLEIGIKAIENENKFKSILYCGRTIYVDENLKEIEMSPKFIKNPSFKNAIIQNIAGGNTMIFNNPIKNIIEKKGFIDHESHDWFLYQITTAIGGKTIYDTIPQILYRQHNNTIIGGNNSVFDKFLRIKNMLEGSHKKWNHKSILALMQYKDTFTDESKIIIIELYTYMISKKYFSLNRLFRLGLYRQTISGNLSLILSVLLRKFI